MISILLGRIEVSWFVFVLSCSCFKVDVGRGMTTLVSRGRQGNFQAGI